MKKIFGVLRAIKSKPVFGRPLTETAIQDIDVNAADAADRLWGVPAVVQRAAEFVVQFGVNDPSLFTRDVDPNRVLALKKLLKRGPLLDSSLYTPAEAAAVLLLFFDSLPESVIPSSKFNDIARTALLDEETERVAAVMGILQGTDCVHVSVLHYLICFLLRLSSFHEYNGLTEPVLASICWKLVLRAPIPADGLDPSTTILSGTAEEKAAAEALMFFFLSNYASIFEESLLHPKYLQSLYKKAAEVPAEQENIQAADKQQQQESLESTPPAEISPIPPMDSVPDIQIQEASPVPLPSPAPAEEQVQPSAAAAAAVEPEQKQSVLMQNPPISQQPPVAPPSAPPAAPHVPEKDEKKSGGFFSSFRARKFKKDIEEPSSAPSSAPSSTPSSPSSIDATPLQQSAGPAVVEQTPQPPQPVAAPAAAPAPLLLAPSATLRSLSTKQLLDGMESELAVVESQLKLKDEGMNRAMGSARRLSLDHAAPAPAPAPVPATPEVTPIAQSDEFVFVPERRVVLNAGAPSSVPVPAPQIQQAPSTPARVSASLSSITAASNNNSNNNNAVPPSPANPALASSSSASTPSKQHPQQAADDAAFQQSLQKQLADITRMADWQQLQALQSLQKQIDERRKQVNMPSASAAPEAAAAAAAVPQQQQQQQQQQQSSIMADPLIAASPSAYVEMSRSKSPAKASSSSSRPSSASSQSRVVPKATSSASSAVPRPLSANRSRIVPPAPLSSKPSAVATKKPGAAAAAAASKNDVKSAAEIERLKRFRERQAAELAELDALIESEASDLTLTEADDMSSSTISPRAKPAALLAAARSSGTTKLPVSSSASSSSSSRPSATPSPPRHRHGDRLLQKRVSEVEISPLRSNSRPTTPRKSPSSSSAAAPVNIPSLQLDKLDASAVTIRPSSAVVARSSSASKTRPSSSSSSLSSSSLNMNQPQQFFRAAAGPQQQQQRGAPAAVPAAAKSRSQSQQRPLSAGRRPASALAGAHGASVSVFSASSAAAAATISSQQAVVAQSSAPTAKSSNGSSQQRGVSPRPQAPAGSYADRHRPSSASRSRDSSSSAAHSITPVVSIVGVAPSLSASQRAEAAIQSHIISRSPNRSRPAGSSSSSSSFPSVPVAFGSSAVRAVSPIKSAAQQFPSFAAAAAKQSYSSSFPRKELVFSKREEEEETEEGTTEEYTEETETGSEEEEEEEEESEDNNSNDEGEEEEDAALASSSPAPLSVQPQSVASGEEESKKQKLKKKVTKKKQKKAKKSSQEGEAGGEGEEKLKKKKKKSKKKKRFSNPGERLYLQGQEQQKKLEEKLHAQRIEKELREDASQFTFHPEISLYSRHITRPSSSSAHDPFDRLYHETTASLAAAAANGSNQHPSPPNAFPFQPHLNPRSEEIAAELAERNGESISPNSRGAHYDSHEKLYLDAKRRQAIKAAMEHGPQPETVLRYASVEEERAAMDRLVYSKLANEQVLQQVKAAMDHAANASLSSSASLSFGLAFNNNSARPTSARSSSSSYFHAPSSISGVSSHHRPPEVPVTEYLYAARHEFEDIRAMLRDRQKQQEVEMAAGHHVSETSKQLVEKRLRKRWKSIFESLTATHGTSGVLWLERVAYERIDQEPARDLRPVLTQLLLQGNGIKSLNFEDFFTLVSQQIKDDPAKPKSYLHHKRTSSSNDGMFTFKPSISAASQSLATGRRRSVSPEKRIEELSKEGQKWKVNREKEAKRLQQQELDKCTFNPKIIADKYPGSNGPIVSKYAQDPSSSNHYSSSSSSHSSSSRYQRSYEEEDTVFYAADVLYPNNNDSDVLSPQPFLSSAPAPAVSSVDAPSIASIYPPPSSSSSVPALSASSMMHVPPSVSALEALAAIDNDADEDPLLPKEHHRPSSSSSSSGAAVPVPSFPAPSLSSNQVPPPLPSDFFSSSPSSSASTFLPTPFRASGQELHQQEEAREARLPSPRHVSFE